jgi:transcriptional regulator with XRE-family HTH domain
MDVRIGARFRALRHRLDWRQIDVARRAGVSQGVVSLVERGQLERSRLPVCGAIARALDADVLVQLRWRGGDLDRLLDEGHASLVNAVVELMRQWRWEIRVEVQYAIYAERGSIDVLAWHSATGTLLVIEVKTELTSVEETLRKHDEKARLAAGIARKQLGWHASGVARLLALPELSTARRRVERYRAALDAAYPQRGQELRRWLRAPSGGRSGLLFLAAGSRDRRHRAVSRKRITPMKASSPRPPQPRRAVVARRRSGGAAYRARAA